MRTMSNSRSNQRNRNQRQYYCSSQVPPYYTYIVQGVPQNMYNNVPPQYPNDLDNNGQFDLSQQQQQFYLAPISDERYMPMQYIQQSEFMVEQGQQPPPQPSLKVPLQTESQQRHLPDNEESGRVEETQNADQCTNSNGQIDFAGQKNCRQPKHENEFDSNSEQVTRQYQYNNNNKQQLEYNVDNTENSTRFSGQFTNGPAGYSYHPHYYSSMGPQMTPSSHAQAQQTMYTPTNHQHPAIGSPLYIAPMYHSQFYPHVAFNVAAMPNQFYNAPQLPHHQPQQQQQQQLRHQQHSPAANSANVNECQSSSDLEQQQQQPQSKSQPDKQLHSPPLPQHQYQYQYKPRKHHNKDFHQKSSSVPVSASASAFTNHFENHKVTRKSFSATVNNVHTNAITSMAAASSTTTNNNNRNTKSDLNETRKIVTTVISNSNLDQSQLRPITINTSKSDKTNVQGKDKVDVKCKSEEKETLTTKSSTMTDKDKCKEKEKEKVAVEQMTKALSSDLSIESTKKEESSTKITSASSAKMNDSNNNEIKEKTWASLFRKSNNNSAVANGEFPKSNVNQIGKTDSDLDLDLESKTDQAQQQDHSHVIVRSSAKKSKPVQQQQQQQQHHQSDEKKSKFDGPIFHRIGEHLSSYKIDRRVTSFQPRGFMNRRYYCYVNSILQALCACSPFVNLFLSLSQFTVKMTSEKASIPIINGITELLREFSILPKEKYNRNNKDRLQKKEDLNLGLVFEPTQIYKILNCFDVLNVDDGRQQDAEEFLGCLLNSLNDEMNELMKFVSDEKTKFVNGNSNEKSVNGNAENDDNENEWTEMGPRNKGAIIRRTDLEKTPISEIFRGQLRSRVHRYGDQVTDNVQPFFTLPLYIEKASSVIEAIELMTEKEPIEGMTCSKTNREIEAWQQVSIEELPLILILHLKCFHYKQQSCTKIVKSFDFPIDLRIDAKHLSSKHRISKFKPQYKLFAVVYHDGREAVKGHYITDAYHNNYATWIRFDDSNVTSVSEQEVLSPSGRRVPYLLYYRKCDQ